MFGVVCRFTKRSVLIELRIEDHMRSTSGVACTGQNGSSTEGHNHLWCSFKLAVMDLSLQNTINDKCQDAENKADVYNH